MENTCPLRFQPQTPSDYVFTTGAIGGAVVGTVIGTMRSWDKSKTSAEMIIRGSMYSAAGLCIGFVSGMLFPFTAPFMAAYCTYQRFTKKLMTTPVDTASEKPE